jgi:hypothetical protein
MKLINKNLFQGIIQSTQSKFKNLVYNSMLLTQNLRTSQKNTKLEIKFRQSQFIKLKLVEK